MERGPNVDSEAPCPRQRGYARCQDREKAQAAWKRYGDLKGLDLDLYNSGCADSNIDEFFKHVEKETKGTDKKWSWVFLPSSFNDDQGGWYRLVILGERSDSEAKEVPMYDGEFRELKKIQGHADIYRGERREGRKTASKGYIEIIKVSEDQGHRDHVDNENPENKIKLKAIKCRKDSDWVGTVGLKAKQNRPGIQICIEAKFSQVYRSIWAMMLTLHRREPIQEGEWRSHENKEGNLRAMYLHLLGERFRVTLETLNGVGLAQVNGKKRIRCTDMRGPIDFTQLSLDCLYAGFPTFVYALSEDNAVNRILKYALIRLLDVLNRMDEHELKSRLQMLQKKMFTNVATSTYLGKEHELEAKDQLGIIDICRIRVMMHRIALCIINSVQPTNTIGLFSLRPWLTNMSTLFEDYIRNLMRQELKSCDVKNPSLKVSGVKPDITVIVDGRVKFVCDVKYSRNKKKQSDHFHQINSYCRSVELEQHAEIIANDKNATGLRTKIHGILVYPRIEEHSHEPEHIHTLSFYGDDETEPFEDTVKNFIDKVKNKIPGLS